MRPRGRGVQLQGIGKCQRYPDNAANGWFVRLRETWSTLGEEDPLWAILSCQGKKGDAGN